MSKSKFELFFYSKDLLSSSFQANALDELRGIINYMIQTGVTLPPAMAAACAAAAALPSLQQQANQIAAGSSDDGANNGSGAETGADSPIKQSKKSDKALLYFSSSSTTSTTSTVINTTSSSPSPNHQSSIKASEIAANQEALFHSVMSNDSIIDPVSTGRSDPIESSTLCPSDFGIRSITGKRSSLTSLPNLFSTDVNDGQQMLAALQAHKRMKLEREHLHQHHHHDHNPHQHNEFTRTNPPTLSDASVCL